ncbi:MAG: hypothetical protein Q8K22_11255 [Rhodoferax sp.]|jgi:hypothetical protein|nr:hypothetical protein [Rhodoferax sp.]
MNNEQIRLAQRLGLAVLESIQEAGELGAPSGVLYAALLHTGCSLNQFQSLMRPLESRGFVVLEDDCYTISESGGAFITRLRSVTAQPATGVA